MGRSEWKESVKDLRWVGVVLVGVVPWVNNTISHQLGVGLSLGCLGHTAGQLQTPSMRGCSPSPYSMTKEKKKESREGREEHTRSTQQHIIHQLR
jgi:hypothetical protein